MIAMNPKVLEIADALDAERAARGPRGPLHGIPIVVKDNFETVDMPTTGGSLALTGFMTGRDAFQVKRLRDAGAIIIGKTNLHELASGITTISSLGGQTRNPYDLVAQPRRIERRHRRGGGRQLRRGRHGQRHVRIDPRFPSANNNLFGLRGTMGLSSRDGIIPLSHTQDIGGPLARTVADLAIMLDATVGADPADAITQASAGHIPASYRDAAEAGRAERRAHRRRAATCSAPRRTMRRSAAIDRKALDAMREGRRRARRRLACRGSTSRCARRALIDAEFKFDLIDYLAHRPNAPVHSLGEILERGDYARGARGELQAAQRADVAPTRPTSRRRARRRAELLALVTRDAWRRSGSTRSRIRRCAARRRAIGEPQRGGENCQLSASTGLPAISMPAGFTDDGVPVGLELLGAAWSEPQLLAMAFAYEQATHPRRPPPTTPGARQRPRAGDAELRRQPGRRARDVLVRSGGGHADVGRGGDQAARRVACIADDRDRRSRRC